MGLIDWSIQCDEMWCETMSWYGGHTMICVWDIGYDITWLDVYSMQIIGLLHRLACWPGALMVVLPTSAWHAKCCKYCWVNLPWQCWGWLLFKWLLPSVMHFDIVAVVYSFFTRLWPASWLAYSCDDTPGVLYGICYGLKGVLSVFYYICNILLMLYVCVSSYSLPSS